MARSSLIFVLASLILAACGGTGASESTSFTLYRNSVTDENMRIHVATFDALDGEAFGCKPDDC